MIWLDTTATRFDVMAIFIFSLVLGASFGWWAAEQRRKIRYHERRQRQAEMRLRELEGKDVN